MMVLKAQRDKQVADALMALKTRYQIPDVNYVSKAQRQSKGIQSLIPRPQATKLIERRSTELPSLKNVMLSSDEA